jgi:hypothetical protein
MKFNSLPLSFAGYCCGNRQSLLAIDSKDNGSKKRTFVSKLAIY